MLRRPVNPIPKRQYLERASCSFRANEGRGRMKRLGCRFLSALIVMFATASISMACAQQIMLRPAAYVCAEGKPLDPGSHAIPCVSDWNEDGLKDLIVGYRTDDKVALYLNLGTDSQPIFNSFANIQADGKEICFPCSGCGAPAPWVCDYDCDGKKDLLVGTGADGYVYFYRNASGGSTPLLADGVALTIGGSTLDAGIRATPYVHDWDEDGLNDLICGDGNGNAHFFKNVGTARSPSYADDTLLQAGGVPVCFGFRSAIRVCDWDGDGLKDLLGSASNNVNWCRNVGTNSVPLLEAPVRLQSPVPGTGLVAIDTGSRMRLEVVDWNDDGVTDLLIGDYQGCISYYEGYRFAFRRIEVQSNGEVTVEWNSADYLKYDLLAGESLDALSVVAGSLPSGGKATAWTDDCQARMRFYKIQLAD